MAKIFKDKVIILQINLHRCKLAQELLTQYVEEKEISIVVISEPYRIPDSWYGDLKHDAAIWVTPMYTRKCSNIQSVTKDKGVVGIAIDQLKVFSCYISPNIPLSEFQEVLALLEKEVSRVGPNHSIIAGDLNAKAVTWGSRYTDNRRYEVLEMAIRNDMTPIRSRGDHTFERNGGKSLIDIMICGKECAAALTKSIILDEYTASDHRYVKHIFRHKNSDKQPKQRTIQQTTTRVDLDKFIDKLQEWT
ncbi:uncharacterized protein LOC144477961 [Augochlora pura]